MKSIKADKRGNRMYYYKIYGFFLESDISFDELVVAKKQDIDEIDKVVHFHSGEIDDSIVKVSDYEKEIKTGYMYRFEENRAWIRAVERACFVIKDGSDISYHLYDNCDMLAVKEVALCSVMFAILYQKKKIVFHGSGICWNGKTFILSGESGAGKSSLAERFFEMGAQMLADDMVVINQENDEFFAVPAYPQQKLCLDQVTDEMKDKYTMILLPPDNGVFKYGVRIPERFVDEEQKLDALFIILPSEVSKTEIEEITGGDKINYLIDNLFQVGIYRKIGLPADRLKKIIAIASNIQVFVIKRPKIGMTVSEQAELVRSALV